jgi:RNA polymerase sigma-70 factor, ECF subfamily
MDDHAAEATRLWTLAQPTVSAFVTSLVREIRDRDNILQEIAVAVMESFATYDRSWPFVAWTIEITHNQVDLYYHRKGRERLVFDPHAIEQLEQASVDVRPHNVRILDYLGECIQSLLAAPASCASCAMSTT